MDMVFKALGDATRRQLLDLLHDSDGRTLGELEACFPQLSRFAVMKHLKILEAAALVSSRKAGRYKFHYLNAVPIQDIADRWISRFARPWSEGLLDLKRDLEAAQSDETNEDVMSEDLTETNKSETEIDVGTKPKHVYHVVIQTTAAKLWQALIQPDITQHYFFGLRVESDWGDGSAIEYRNNEGEAMVAGRIIESVAERSLVYSFRGFKIEGDKREPDSRVSFEIEALGENACKLTVVHDDFPSENTTFREVGNGWPTILSGLKTWLETGKPLIIEDTES